MTAWLEKRPFSRRDSEAWKGDNCVPVSPLGNCVNRWETNSVCSVYTLLSLYCICICCTIRIILKRLISSVTAIIIYQHLLFVYHASFYTGCMLVLQILKSVRPEKVSHFCCVCISNRDCCLCPAILGWLKSLLPTAPTTRAVESVCCLEILTVPGQGSSVQISNMLQLRGQCISITCTSIQLLHSNYYTNVSSKIQFNV